MQLGGFGWMTQVPLFILHHFSLKGRSFTLVNYVGILKKGI